MRYWSSLMARLSLSGWVGAAVFFVAVAIRPIRSPHLDTPGKALLAGLLFPGYYAFGFTLLGLGWLATLLSRPRRWSWQLGWVTLALLIAGADWVWIYGPLAEMTRLQWTEQAPQSASFRGYHLASMAINTALLLCSAVAAVLAALPEGPESSAACDPTP